MPLKRDAEGLLSSADYCRYASVPAGVSEKGKLANILMCHISVWSPPDHIQNGGLKYSHCLMMPVSAICGGALPLYIRMFSGNA